MYTTAAVHKFSSVQFTYYEQALRDSVCVEMQHDRLLRVAASRPSFLCRSVTAELAVSQPVEAERDARRQCCRQRAVLERGRGARGGGGGGLAAGGGDGRAAASHVLLERTGDGEGRRAPGARERVPA